MQKIGVLSLYGYFNYGNRFQNYAVQEIIKKYGYSVDTIVVYPNCKQIIKTSLNRLKYLRDNIKAKRYIKIYNFSRKYIKIKTFINKHYCIPSKIKGEYDYFVVGSDQVWNPLIRPNERSNFFLTFAKKQQRICISPSFGVDYIAPEYRQLFVDGLNGFNHLCSREESGIRIIKQLTGRDAELLIDPTLALTKEEWFKISSTESCPKTQYILVAMLGDKSNETNQYIDSLSKKYNLKIIDVFSDSSAYSPDEVLGLISQAQLVFTDSFHFSAFSINFNTPFIVIERLGDAVNSSMYSRIESLLSLFELKERMFQSIQDGQELYCDFNKSNKVLDLERVKFYRYVDKCLGLST